MFEFIKGRIEVIESDYIVIENNNIGFKIMTSANVITRVTLHQSITIYTYMNVREDDISLFGFLSKDELSVFKLLISISGIGPKGALAIMSALSMDELRMAVIASDYKAISKANGIGLKTAQRVVIELKDKFKLEDVIENASAVNLQDAPRDGIINDAVLALVALGYSKGQSLRVATKTALCGNYETVEELIKASLKNMI